MTWFEREEYMSEYIPEEQMGVTLNNIPLNIIRMDAQVTSFDGGIYYNEGRRAYRHVPIMGHEFHIEGILDNNTIYEQILEFGQEHNTVQLNWNNTIYECFIRDIEVSAGRMGDMYTHFSMTLITQPPDYVQPLPKPPKKTLDILYPHKCHKCNKKLKFEEFRSANFQKNIEHLKELWITKEVKLLCCSCHKKKIRTNYSQQHGGWRSEEDVPMPYYVDAYSRGTMDAFRIIMPDEHQITGDPPSTITEIMERRGHMSDVVGFVDWNGTVSNIDCSYNEGDIVSIITHIEPDGTPCIEYRRIENGVPVDPTFNDYIDARTRAWEELENNNNEDENNETND